MISPWYFLMSSMIQKLTDFKFVNPTSVQGYVGLSGTDYDAVHKAYIDYVRVYQNINNKSKFIKSIKYLSLKFIKRTSFIKVK